MSGPGDPQYEAKLAADIARLQAAKGISPRAWLRENKTLLLVFLAYLAVVLTFVGVAVAKGESPGGAALVAIFVAPVVMLRVYVRWKR
jgi:hypothetical protein